MLWINDTILVTKPLNGKVLHYVADAVTGTPVASAELEFFGFRYEAKEEQKPTIVVKKLLATTDKDGQVILGEKEIPLDRALERIKDTFLTASWQWLITRRSGPS